MRSVSCGQPRSGVGYIARDIDVPAHLPAGFENSSPSLCPPTCILYTCANTRLGGGVGWLVGPRKTGTLAPRRACSAGGVSGFAVSSVGGCENGVESGFGFWVSLPRFGPRCAALRGIPPFVCWIHFEIPGYQMTYPLLGGGFPIKG